MAGKRHASRNSELAGGISRYSRSAMYKRKALYKKKKVAAKSPKKSKPYYKLQPIKGEKNGDKRPVLLKKSVSFLLKRTPMCLLPYASSTTGPTLQCSPYTLYWCSLATTPLRTTVVSCTLVRNQAVFVCGAPSHQALCSSSCQAVTAGNESSSSNSLALVSSLLQVG